MNKLRGQMLAQNKLQHGHFVTHKLHAPDPAVCGQ